MTRRHTFYTLPNGRRLEVLTDGCCLTYPRFARALPTPLSRKGVAFLLHSARAIYGRGMIKKAIL